MGLLDVRMAQAPAPSEWQERYSAQANPQSLPTVNLHGVTLHAITEKQTIDTVLSELDAKRDGIIITVNLDHLRRYGQDAEYRKYNDDATLRVADGMPLIWASRLQGTALPERVTGSNLIWSLTEAAANNERSLFLLGGEPGTAEATAKILTDRFPKLKIAGTACPQISSADDEATIASIADTLAAAKPDIVYVALGSPKQDALIDALRGRLPAVWWMGVGIAFSFVSGTVNRAPLWIQTLGLEWLHRLLQEPRRLARRYIRQGLPFFLSLNLRAILRRFNR